MKGQMKNNPTCSNCKTRETPLWRKGPNNTYNCNACGLYYKIYEKNRPFQYKTTTYRHRKRSKKEEDRCDDKDAQHQPKDGVLQHCNGSDPCEAAGARLDGSPVREKPVLNKKISECFDVSDTSSAKNKSMAEKKHRMPRVSKMGGSKPNKRVVGAKAGRGVFDNLYNHGNELSQYPQRYLGTNSYADAAQDPQRPFSTYRAEGHFKMPRPIFNTYLNSRSIDFPEIKLVANDPFSFKARMGILNDEEMEAAEALADFAFSAKSKE